MIVNGHGITQPTANVELAARASGKKRTMNINAAKARHIQHRWAKALAG